jgi:sigma-B regulation protein RsbU (phosphoserine phosphatase)
VAIANAGQPMPLLNGGEVPIKGLPLGASKGTVYRELELVLGPSDSLLLYSDGLEDIENDQGEQFGLDRLRTRLVDAAHQTPQSVLGELNKVLAAYRGQVPVADDLTIALLQRVPQEAAPTPQGRTQAFSMDTAKGTRPI